MMALCQHLGVQVPTCSGQDPCAPQPEAASCPFSHCREMLVCLVWMAALAWRASLDHR